MSGFDWDRKGPPRPGAGATDRPYGIERPYVHRTEAEQRQRRIDRAEEAKKRGRAIKAAEYDARFGPEGNPYRD